MSSPRPLGPAAPRVHPIGFGAAPLSIPGRPSERESVGVIHRALELGATLIDTADAYSLGDHEAGHSERLVARALREYAGDRDDVVVATKGGVRRPGGEWVRDGRPEHLRAACERSRRALGVDRIDLYQLHSPDPDVPFAESVGALEALRREGAIRHVGLCNVTVAQLEAALEVTPVACVQNGFSPWDQTAESSGLIAACERRGTGFVAHSPLGGNPRPDAMAGTDVVRAVAVEHGASPEQIALAWVLARSPITIAIPGTRRTDHLEANMAAADLHLSADELSRIAEACDRG